MKRKIIIIFCLICIILFFYINIKTHLFFNIQHVQLKLMKKFVKSIKQIDNYYWLIISFLYGMVHSMGPGHGKSFLIALSFTHKKRQLIFFSALIVYIQGIISYLIIILLFNNRTINVLLIKKIDRITIFVYIFFLIFLSLYEIIHEFIHKKQKDKFFLAGAFFPCSGVLTLLIAVKVTGHAKYLFPAAVIMSTGMFVTLSIFSLFLDKVNNICFISVKKIKYCSLIFYGIIFLMGVYHL